MPRQLAWVLIGLCLFAAAASASAANLVIYDDASRNGFNDGCTFNAIANFAETAVVHTGNDAISFAPAQNGAVSWCTPGSLSTTNSSGITFWVNGGASGGQNLELVFGLAGVVVTQASLDTLLGQPIPANTWVQVTTSFDNAPTQFNGNFDQISIQDNSGNAAVSPQPTVYFDDITLIGRVSGVDEIFKSGFEPVTTTATIQIEQNVTCAGVALTSERYTWKDSGGWTRSATLSHNDAGNGGHLGELCDYTYHTDAVTVRDVQELTAGQAGGFGYIVSHLHDASLATSHGEDDSPLGHGFTGTYMRLLNGRHHAILRFQLNYPRWGVDPADNVAKKYNVPVTIDWLIATGRDHPLWSVSYDLTAAPADAIKADSRAPYGDMAFDGAGTAAGYGGIVGGVAWGDHYKFTTTDAPMTLNSNWTWNQLNTIPYVYLWAQSVDAEMGIVQSEDIPKQDAGSEFSSINWNHTSADIGRKGCTATNLVMPCVDYQWAYQANADDSSTVPEPDKHLTWGTGYGFLGGTGYNTDGSLTNTGVGWPRQSYSTHIVLDRHSLSPSTAQVIQVENAMSSTFSASVGTVLTSGPAGVNRVDTRAYLPAGYNRVYGTWDVDVGASGNAATVALNGAGVGLTNPIFLLHHHSAALPANVTLDGTALVADVDYFATVDSANADHPDTRLWITVNRAWMGNHTLTVN